MSDESNEDIISNPILPLLFANIRSELTTNPVFLLEMKVNPEEVDPDSLDPNKVELNSVYKNFDTLDFNIVFNLFEYKENQSFASHKFDE